MANEDDDPSTGSEADRRRVLLAELAAAGHGPERLSRAKLLMTPDLEELVVTTVGSPGVRTRRHGLLVQLANSGLTSEQVDRAAHLLLHDLEELGRTTTARK